MILFVLSESFLDSTIFDDDNILHMEGHNLVRANHPGNIKRGAVCLHFKKILAIRNTELSHITRCEVNVKGQEFHYC